MLAILATALLVERFTRRYAGRAPVLFAAWRSCSARCSSGRSGSPSRTRSSRCCCSPPSSCGGPARSAARVPRRWLACGGLLAILAMAKGPQPVGFFALGVGGYIVVRRRWTALPGLVLCLALPAAATLAWAAASLPGRPGPLVWFTYLRVHDLRFNARHYVRERLRFAVGLPIDLLPSTLLIPAALRAWRRAPRDDGSPSPVLPLAAYILGHPALDFGMHAQWSGVPLSLDATGCWAKTKRSRTVFPARKPTSTAHHTRDDRGVYKPSTYCIHCFRTPSGLIRSTKANTNRKLRLGQGAGQEHVS